MNLKYSVIIILIVLIVISIRTEFTKEQRYCHELSGQSSISYPSEDFLICEKTAFCKTIIQAELTNKAMNSSSDLSSYSCVHIDTDETIHPQKLQTVY